jgi:hypothetical protein
MKYKKGDPRSPEVINEAIEMIRQMTPEEALAFFTYRTPGVEETDMTGMLSNGKSPHKTVPEKHRIAAK